MKTRTVWDGDDARPDTEVGLSVNDVGCPENELDDDNDGYTNDLDDCDDVAGTSYLDKIDAQTKMEMVGRILMIHI